MEPTEEQQHILKACADSSDNIMMNALAGTGKTSTLEMVEGVVDSKPILYLVFAKRNAEEATKRMASTTTVRTFNALGHRIWAKAIGKNLALNAKKITDLLRALIDESPKDIRPILWDSFWDIAQGVNLARVLGYVPDGKFPQARRLITREEFHDALEESPDDLIADCIDAILLRSIKAAYEGLIDFNDQIYLPALFGGSFPRFPLVLVDEYQDLNPVNHAMLDKLCRNRLIGVGDPWQNIYGFRGALAKGMAEAQAKFNMTPCDLSVSFRCPQAIVENARWRVPHFKWMKEGGSVDILDKLVHSGIGDDSVVLCRNNAPLLSTALRLLASSRSVSVVGSDIGPRLVAQMKKLGDASMSRASLLSAIDDWFLEKDAKGNKSAADLAECMRVFAGFGTTLGSAISYAEHLFAQRGAIKLMTGHKSKGLEFDFVYHLDPWLCRDDEQDKNLRYVIGTRSKDAYREINSSQIQWS